VPIQQDHRRQPAYATTGAPLIEVEGLSYTFDGSPAPALNRIRLSVRAGDFLVVTGPSGCGKSTLALAIGGYLFQQYAGEAQGSVTVAGMDARSAPVYEIADVVGLVQQNPAAQFCTLTVRDEVAFGLENRCLPRTEIRERMDRALEISGAAHLAHRTLSTLSGGEQQKVAIASVLALQPQVLMLDEPTSNLDPTATAEIFDVIERMREEVGLAVIVIEHKTAYLRRFAPRLIRMERGHIVRDGPLPKFDAGKAPPRPGREAPAPPLSTPIVALTRNLSVCYGQRSVLRDLSLEIRRGEFIAVMGDNGSGKTTLLHTLLGLTEASRGTVRVLGHDVSRVPVSQLAREVGFVFQNPDHQLFAGSVWEEATLAAQNFDMLEADRETTIHRMLREAGLTDREDDHPYRLSYGEKRRLNLISVLGYRPRLLLLDEILIGQDRANVAYLMALLTGAVEGGTTVVMVNHNPAVTLQYTDRVLFLEDGQLRIDGPPAQALEQIAGMGHPAYAPEEPSYAAPHRLPAG
jgi:energy-coupling factor transport system ATP-binding protein